MDFIACFVPPSVLDDPRKNVRHRGIAKSLLTISLFVSLIFLSFVAFFAQWDLSPTYYALFGAAICTPVLGALLIRATGDITLGLVATNIGGILIGGTWAFLTGGIYSMSVPVFLVFIAMLSTFGNVAILLVMGAIMMGVLVFLYLSTSLGWLSATPLPGSDMPELRLTTMLGLVGLVVFAGVGMARDRALNKNHLRSARRAAGTSEERWKFALEGAGDGVWDWNFLTGEAFVSTQYKALLGYADTDVFYGFEEWKSLLHAEDRGRAIAVLESYLDGATLIYMDEYRIQCKDGCWKWMLNRGMAVSRNAKGKPLRMIGTISDLTERKRTEEALRQQHARLLETERELLKAQESLAEAARLESVGRLAAGVAHEVKNPLSIIRLGVDYLAKKFSQESNHEVLDDVRVAIDRADNVIKDLLDLSRQKPFSLHQINIDQVIDNAIRLTRHEMERRNITIIRKPFDPLPPIYADPDRLVQVFINLLSNAAQAIGQIGRIEVVVRSIRLNERDLERPETGMFRIGEQVIAVEIRDNGPGFPAEYEKKLFEPFFTTKPVGEGSGLGLAVSRSIVIMHRGFISISNHPEGGASALLMFRADQGHLTNEKANTDNR